MAEGGRRRRSAPLVASTPAPAAKDGDDRRPVVLVVDDEEPMREMLRISLGLEGWTVVEATSGEEALATWHQAGPDVVLLDQHLKGMTGLQCAAQLRAMKDDVRIILFSGYLDPEASKEARRLRLLPLEKTDHRRLFDLLGVLAEQVRTSSSRVS